MTKICLNYDGIIINVCASTYYRIILQTVKSEFLFLLYLDTKEISITKLQELHWSLCDCIKMVNDKFGWYIFLELFLNCVQLIVTPYFMIMDLFFPMIYGSANIKFILVQVIWVLTHMSHLLLIVLPTSYATKKVGLNIIIFNRKMKIHT